MQTLGFAMCGSFCTLDKAMEQMAKLGEKYALLPVMSQNVYETDTARTIDTGGNPPDSNQGGVAVVTDPVAYAMTKSEAKRS